MSITTWTITKAPDGAPLINSSPTDVDLDRADAVLRFDLATHRYAIEAARADLATAERLAAAALANVDDGATTWHRVRPGDLVREPASESARERNRDAILPGDPRWTAEAMTLLELGYPDHEAREAARERLIARALAERWSLKQLGHAILREKAEAQDETHVWALHVIDMKDPIAARLGKDDSANVWKRVIRPPREGEVTIAMRGGF